MGNLEESFFGKLKTNNSEAPTGSCVIADNLTYLSVTVPFSYLLDLTRSLMAEICLLELWKAKFLECQLDFDAFIHFCGAQDKQGSLLGKMSE